MPRFACGFQRRMVVLSLFVTAYLQSCGTTVLAQPNPPDPASAGPRALTDDELQQRRVAMEQKVEGLLKELELFFKTGKDKAGHATYTVMFDYEGHTSKLELSIKQPGKYEYEPLWALYTYTVVAEIGPEKLSPAAISAVASATDNLTVGSYSISSNEQNVYANSSAYINHMSAGELWLTLALTHNNRQEMLETLQPLLKAQN